MNYELNWIWKEVDVAYLKAVDRRMCRRRGTHGRDEKAYKILVGNSKGKRPSGRHRHG
jgi:hypothetical protein